VLFEKVEANPTIPESLFQFPTNTHAGSPATK
jgi:hypothetical protein